MLDVRRLRALREVAVHGSFSEAAAKLNYTQSAISQQVAQLERQVGVLLVERRGRRVELTAAGRALVEHTESILRHLSQAETELEAAAGMRRGAMRIAASASAAATWLPTAIRRFARRFPEAVVSMAVLEGRAALAGVQDGQADVAVFTRSESVAEGDQVVVVDLVEDPICLALPIGHHLAGRPVIELGELAGESWVVSRKTDPDWENLVARCGRIGFTPRVVFCGDDHLAVQGLVSAGLGIAAVPAMVAAAALRTDVAVRPLGDDELVQPVAAAIRRGVGEEPAIAAMLEILEWCAVACSLEATPNGLRIPYHRPGRGDAATVA